jgi:hypothetical protein
MTINALIFPLKFYLVYVSFNPSRTENSDVRAMNNLNWKQEYFTVRRRKHRCIFEAFEKRIADNSEDVRVCRTFPFIGASRFMQLLGDP